MVRKSSLLIAMALSLTLASCGEDDPPVGSDTTPPTVVSTLPADGASSVSIGTTIRIELSECLNSASVTDTSLVVSGDVTGTASCSDSLITFTPDAVLEYSTVYDVTLRSTVTDQAGNSLADDYNWSFTTETDPNTGVVWNKHAVPEDLETPWFLDMPVTNGVYVAVSNGWYSGEFMYSNNGTDWQIGSTGTAEGIVTCFWLDTAFFAFGMDDNVFVSKNAVNWTQASSSPGPSIRRAASSGTLYVGAEPAYGHNRVYTSTDGVNWTETGDHGHTYFGEIVWTGTRFVAAVTDEETLHGSIVTSDDGITWTTQYTDEDHYPLELIYSGQELICTGSDGYNIASSDGLTWTPIANDFDDSFHELIWAGDRWAALADNHYILSSIDGRSWDTMYYDPGIHLSTMAWIDSKYIVVGGDTVLTSP